MAEVNLPSGKSKKQAHSVLPCGTYPLSTVNGQSLKKVRVLRGILSYIGATRELLERLKKVLEIGL